MHVNMASAERHAKVQLPEVANIIATLFSHRSLESSIKPKVRGAFRKERSKICRSKGAEQSAVAILALIFVREEILHRDDIAFEPDYFGDVGHASDAIAHPRYLNDKIDRTDDLGSYRLLGQVADGHGDHVF